MNILKFNFKVDIMEVKNFKTHWDNAYKNSNIEDLGWYERTPKATLGLFEKYNISKDSVVFNAGAGCTTFIKFLLERGYRNIIVNDISSIAINKLRGELYKYDNIKWITDDLTNSKKVKIMQKIDFWYDRAVLHFFTDEEQQRNYFSLISDKINIDGYVLLSQFAKGGAKKCCGLDVVNYDDQMFQNGLGDKFKLVESFLYSYQHPYNSNRRKYIYSLYKRINK